jgi:hypothetical protein
MERAMDAMVETVFPLLLVFSGLLAILMSFRPYSRRMLFLISLILIFPHILLFQALPVAYDIYRGMGGFWHSVRTIFGIPLIIAPHIPLMIIGTVAITSNTMMEKGRRTQAASLFIIWLLGLAGTAWAYAIVSSG